MATRLTTLQIVSQLKEELDRLLEADSESLRRLSEAPRATARVDILQTDTTICIVVEVPGMAAEDLEVIVTGDEVTVSGDRVPPRAPAQTSRFLCVERQWGRFERRVELPAPVNARHGRAVLDHGILRIEFPILDDQRNQPFRLAVEGADGERLE